MLRNLHRIARGFLRPSLTLALGWLPAAAAAQATFPAEVQSVRLFLRAEAGGEFVAGLTVADLEVKEDGRRISSFRLVELGIDSSAASRTSGLGSDERDFATNFAVVVDDYVPAEAHLAYLREHLKDFIQKLRGPSYVSLFAPASRVGVRGRLPEGAELLYSALDHVHPSAEFRRAYFPSSDGFTLTEAEILAFAEDMRIERLAAFRAAAASLDGLTGDRIVLYVARRAIEYMPEADRRVFQGVLDSVRRANARMVAVEYEPPSTLPPMIPLKDQESPIQNRLGPSTQEMTDPKRRAFFSDPRGQAPFDLSHAVAIDTGGFSTRGLLPSSLESALRQSQSNYLVAYERSSPPDGRFHKIEVTVKRKGVRLHHRKGYFAK